jgi:hypothetical protein
MHEEPSHVVVVADVPVEHALGENGSRHDDVARLLAKYPQASAALLVDRRQAVDATGVEDDDQPAAL